jgi:hypothetical protein
MTGKKIYAIIALAVLSACGSNKGDQRMIGDKQLTIQVQKLEADDNKSRSIQVRLFPDKAALAELSAVRRQNLWYQMDSCFYLETGTKKIYPSSVSPIANGLSASLEYLVNFNETVPPNVDVRLIYQDRYLNNKKYELYKHL